MSYKTLALPAKRNSFSTFPVPMFYAICAIHASQYLYFIPLIPPRISYLHSDNRPPHLNVWLGFHLNRPYLQWFSPPAKFYDKIWLSILASDKCFPYTVFVLSIICNILSVMPPEFYCHCTKGMVEQYLKKISQPLLDRIDKIGRASCRERV